MPWVYFEMVFTWDPPERNGRVTLVYAKGTTQFVRRACAEEVMRQKKGGIVSRPEDYVRYPVKHARR